MGDNILYRTECPDREVSRYNAGSATRASVRILPAYLGPRRAFPAEHRREQESAAANRQFAPGFRHLLLLAPMSHSLALVPRARSSHTPRVPRQHSPPQRVPPDRRGLDFPACLQGRADAADDGIVNQYSPRNCVVAAQPIGAQDLNNLRPFCCSRGHVRPHAIGGRLVLAVVHHQSEGRRAPEATPRTPATEAQPALCLRI